MNLLWEIRKSAWLIEHDFAKSYLPLALKFLRGEQIAGVKVRDVFGAKVVSEEGKAQMNSEEGAINNEPVNGGVMVIPVKGPMTKYGTMCEYGTTEIAPFLYKAADTKGIDGVVLDIDTGGGSVNSVQPLVDAIKYVRSRNKAVAVYGDLIASAGYLIACYANRIYLSSDMSSNVGSIGVYMTLVDDTKMYENMGYILHEIYPPESNYKNKDVKEALEGNYEILIQEYLSPLAVKFQEVVKMNRKKLDMKAEGILNGRMFMAEDAVKYGLADEIGTIDKAINFVKGFRMINN